MSKGLEDLKDVKKLASAYAGDKYAEVITEDIEKELKALEIIKNKPQYELYLIQLGKIKNYNEYLEIVRDWDLEYGGDMEYTEEEFNLLREMFCNE